ncbi:MAG: cation transporter [Clostridiales bacterium]|nr:cation transporter [Clostridiales bacterium]
MNGQSRSDIGKKTGFIGIVANIILACCKLIVGILSSSMSIIADALNNFTDCLSSVITMIGFRLAQKPADEDHPFGHARFEYISSLIVSVAVMFVGFELAKSSIEKIFNPEAISFSVITVVVLVMSIAVKLGLYVYNMRVAKKIDSASLKATAIDCRNDVIMTSVVLISTLVEHFTSLAIDAYTGAAVSIFILFSGVMLVKETASPILGGKNDESIKEIILSKLSEYPFIEGYHDLMIHDYGPGASFCSIHFEVDKNRDPLYVHEMIDKFEREFTQYGIQLTVHYDPVVTDSPELTRIKSEILEALAAIDERLSAHDMRSIPCDGFTRVFMDIPLPLDIANKRDEIYTKVNERLNSIGETVYEPIITFDSYSFN